MMQFSCYLRFTSGKEHAETLTRRISVNVPSPARSRSLVHGQAVPEHPQLSRPLNGMAEEFGHGSTDIVLRETTPVQAPEETRGEATVFATIRDEKTP